MLRGFSVKANEFQKEACSFIKQEGFARFLDVVIEIVELTDPQKTIDSNLKMNLSRLSRVLSDLQREDEITAKGDRYAKFSNCTKN